MGIIQNNFLFRRFDYEFDDLKTSDLLSYSLHRLNQIFSIQSAYKAKKRIVLAKEKKNPFPK